MIHEASLSSIDTMILAGGLGTRLQQAVGDRPKPLAAIGGRPFLDLLIDDLLVQGLRRFIFCVSHRREQIIEHFHRRRDGEFLYSEEVSPLGTGGAVRHALPLIRSNPFLVLNGDSHCRVDLAALLDFHKSRNGAAALVVTAARDRNDGGSIELTADGRIAAFREKAAPGGAESALINAGIYVLERDLPETWPQPDPLSLEHDVFPQLAAEGSCFGFPVDAEVIDIGTPERYADAQQRLPGITGQEQREP
jgi:NDP-sugar pyrophosphorylase family protein